KRQIAESERLGATLGLVQIGPRHARPGQRGAQVVAAVAFEHETGDREPVLVVKGQVTIDRAAPPPVAQAIERRSVGPIATFEARGMGISCVRRGKTGPEAISVLGGPLSGFGLAAPGRSAVEPAGVTAPALLTQVAVAHAALVQVETLEAAAAAEGVVMIVDRLRQLGPASEIAAVVPRLVRVPQSLALAYIDQVQFLAGVAVTRGRAVFFA